MPNFELVMFLAPSLRCTDGSVCFLTTLIQAQDKRTKLLKNDSCRQQVSENRCVHRLVYNGGTLMQSLHLLQLLPHSKSL